ncbi:MAG: hypothetical protein ACRDNT_24685 [Streptosporangiaceae bacterium]
MSEYRYYEFLAIDRPLNERQRAELRSLLTVGQLGSGEPRGPVSQAVESVESDEQDLPRQRGLRHEVLAISPADRPPPHLTVILLAERAAVPAPVTSMLPVATSRHSR